jgi:hypothetical protein
VYFKNVLYVVLSNQETRLHSTVVGLFFMYLYTVLWKLGEVYDLHSKYGIILTVAHKIVDRKRERNNHLARRRLRR